MDGINTFYALFVMGAGWRQRSDRKNPSDLIGVIKLSYQSGRSL